MNKIYTHFFKRIFDFVIALMVLIAISPILLVITILLLIFNEGAGAFFFQERPGRGGKLFKIVKFKTMNEKRDCNGNLLPDIQRITRFGNFVRKTSLDELPQLWNVLTGDMALIGPRPLLVKYLPLYTPEQMRRHDVRPGISGWAQCHGRNSLTWTEKFKLDVWYVDHISLKTDILIVVTTIKKVLFREDVNNEGNSVNDSNERVTMPEFNGKN